MDLKITDPEFTERFEYFAFNEVVNEESYRLDTETRYIAVLAALIGCGGADAFREMFIKALDDGISPITVKEIVYQATECCRFSNA